MTLRDPITGEPGPRPDGTVPQIHQRRCLACQTVFRCLDPKRIYCSDRCRVRGHRAKLTRAAAGFTECLDCLDVIPQTCVYCPACAQRRHARRVARVQADAALSQGRRGQSGGFSA